MCIRDSHADDHVQGAGRDEQLAAVVGIQRQGAVDQVGRVEDVYKRQGDLSSFDQSFFSDSFLHRFFMF